MSNSSYKLLIWILLMLGALGAAYSSVLARPAANVGLTRFAAVPLDNAVRLEWDTETELGTAGYRLKRGQGQGFDYLTEADTTSPLFISSQGGPATGASYSFTDETALNGESYVYQLVEVEANGSEIIQAESEVLVGLIPTETPIVVASGGAGSPENIAQVTETPTATATTSPTVGATAAPPQTAPVVDASQVAAVTAAPNPKAPAGPASQTVAEPAAQVAAASEVQPTSAMNVSGANTDVGPRPAVAVAQEDPQSYPVDEPTAASSSETENQQGTELSPGSLETAQPGDSPENSAVIGATAYPVNPQTPALAPVDVNTDSTSTGSVFAGRLYLWVGFLAALIIFGAAVLGAILLYTRRRSKE